MKIYTAGPISGQSYDQVMKRYQEQVQTLSVMGYEVLCPMTGKTYLRNELKFRASGYEQHPVSTNHAIKERDKWMVKSVDIVLVDFTQCNGFVSIGSCMELAWADDYDKHTLVIMEKENIHQHAFVLECADIVFPTISDAYKYLDDLKKGISI